MNPIIITRWWYWPVKTDYMSNFWFSLFLTLKQKIKTGFEFEIPNPQKMKYKWYSNNNSSDFQCFSENLVNSYIMLLFSTHPIRRKCSKIMIWERYLKIHELSWGVQNYTSSRYTSWLIFIYIWIKNVKYFWIFEILSGKYYFGIIHKTCGKSLKIKL